MRKQLQNSVKLPTACSISGKKCKCDTENVNTVYENVVNILNQTALHPFLGSQCCLNTT